MKEQTKDLGEMLNSNIYSNINYEGESKNNVRKGNIEKMTTKNFPTRTSVETHSFSMAHEC